MDTSHKCNLRKTFTWWRTSNDLVIICHLYAFSSADVFNLYTYLGFCFGSEGHIHSSRSVFRHLLHAVLPLKQPQAWLLMKFNFVPQDNFVLRYMRVYYKCHPNNNPCFDTSIHGENGTHQIKVMINLATERIFFLEKLKSKTIVMLTGLCSLKNSIQSFYSTIVSPKVEWVTIQLVLNTKNR